MRRVLIALIFRLLLSRGGQQLSQLTDGDS
jgi:hypothetical protein